MRKILLVAALLALAWTLGASAAEISIDHQRDVDFGKYKTFRFVSGNPAADPNIHKFILEKIEGYLTAAGLKKVEEGGDLFVLYSVSLQKDTKIETVIPRNPVTNLPKWDYSSFVRNGQQVDQKELTEGSLVIDIEEAATLKLLWRGAATEVMITKGDADLVRKQIEEGVRLMMKDFPPKMEKPAAKKP